MQHPNHLLVLVNGLWGWQRDWANMKKALDTYQDGSYLIHASAVNVGSQTYEGSVSVHPYGANMYTFH